MIIGAAFTKIITSLVDHVVMPPIGLLLSGVDFSHLQWVLKPDNPATRAADPVAIQYGAFINTLIQFLIVAWVVFLIVKAANYLRRKQDAEGSAVTPAPTVTESLLAEIRDELKARPPV